MVMTKWVFCSKGINKGTFVSVFPTRGGGLQRDWRLCPRTRSHGPRPGPPRPGLSQALFSGTRTLPPPPPPKMLVKHAQMSFAETQEKYFLLSLRRLGLRFGV